MSKQSTNALNADMNGTKPAYHVPTMEEIEAIPYNGFDVVSTFSGGGGSCLGYRMAGYHVINEDLLRMTGFKKIDCFWRCLNFAGWIAIK